MVTRQGNGSVYTWDQVTFMLCYCVGTLVTLYVQYIDNPQLTLCHIFIGTV